VTPAAARSAVTDGVDLNAVAAAVRGCPGVDDLDGGPPAERVATYLPGRTIDGLKVTQDTLTVQIRGVWNVPVVQIGAQIRVAVANLAVGRTVDIVIADLTPPPGYEPAPQPELQLAFGPTGPGSGQAPPASAVAAVRPADVDPSADPVASVPAPASVVAQPVRTVVVERTVSMTGRVRPVPPEADPEQRPEEDLVVWTSQTPTADTNSTGDAGDASSSAPTTPTPAVIPPLS